jgi:hypothetical protein
VSFVRRNLKKAGGLNSGLTNRNLNRHYLTDKVASQTEVQRLYGVRGVNEAGEWNERGCP